MSHLYSGASFISHTMIQSGEKAKKAQSSKSNSKSNSKQSQAQQNKNYATSKSKSHFSFWTKKKYWKSLESIKMVSNVYSLGVQIVFPLVSSRCLELSRFRQFCASWVKKNEISRLEIQSKIDVFAMKLKSFRKSYLTNSYFFFSNTKNSKTRFSNLPRDEKNSNTKTVKSCV